MGEVGYAGFKLFERAKINENIGNTQRNQGKSIKTEQKSHKRHSEHPGKQKKHNTKQLGQTVRRYTRNTQKPNENTPINEKHWEHTQQNRGKSIKTNENHIRFADIQEIHRNLMKTHQFAE